MKIHLIQADELQQMLTQMLDERLEPLNKLVSVLGQRYATAKEAAGLLGVTQRTLRNYEQQGRLTRVNPGEKFPMYQMQQILNLVK